MLLTLRRLVEALAVCAEATWAGAGRLHNRILAECGANRRRCVSNRRRTCEYAPCDSAELLQQWDRSSDYRQQFVGRANLRAPVSRVLHNLPDHHAGTGIVEMGKIPRQQHVHAIDGR
jgi:hypothetical protein